MDDTKPINLLRESDAAARLEVSVYTLQRWRSRGEGPHYLKLGTKKGSAVRYRSEDIDSFPREKGRSYER